MGEGTQKSLLALRDSELKDDAMLDAFTIASLRPIIIRKII